MAVRFPADEPILQFKGLEFFAEIHHYLDLYWHYLPIIALD